MKLLLHATALAGAFCAVSSLTTKQPKPHPQQERKQQQQTQEGAIDVADLPNVFEMMDTAPVDRFVSRDECV